jgi:prepilin-type N-terminal cleavage/methylation domain-containing protein
MMKPRQAAFTLIELMVTIAIAAILLGIAAPSFLSMIARQRIEGAANELAVHLRHEATEAVNHNASVSLVSSSTGYTTSSGNVVTLGSGLSITSGVTATFNPMRADSNEASFTISSTNTSDTLRVDTSVVGLVTICSSSGAIGGYASCLP